MVTVEITDLDTTATIRHRAAVGVFPHQQRKAVGRASENLATVLFRCGIPAARATPHLRRRCADVTTHSDHRRQAPSGTLERQLGEDPSTARRVPQRYRMSGARKTNQDSLCPG